MPLHVVAGFLESDRGINDSGVCGMNGIVIQGSKRDVSVKVKCRQKT